MLRFELKYSKRCFRQHKAGTGESASFPRSISNYFYLFLRVEGTKKYIVSNAD